MTQSKTNGSSDELVASVQVATLTPGLYSVTRGPLTEAPRELQGLRVPVAQFAPAPSVDSRIEILGDSAGAAGWLLQPGDTVLLRAIGPAPRLVITSYRAADQARGTMPLRLTRLDGPEAAVTSGSGPAAATASPPFDVLLHLSNLGDQGVTTQSWAGPGNPNHRVEGFAARPAGGVPAEAIEYRVQTQDGVIGGWQPGGSFLGTRGAGLALTGFAARLAPAYAPRFTLRYAGLFAQGGASRACSDGEMCTGANPGDALLALRFELVAKEFTAAAATRVAAPTAPAPVKTKIATKKPPAKKPVAKKAAKPAAKPAKPTKAAPVKTRAAKKPAKKKR